MTANRLPSSQESTRAYSVTWRFARESRYSRGVLTGLLWGERSEDQARASLRQTLSELRGALAEPARQSIMRPRRPSAGRRIGVDRREGVGDRSPVPRTTMRFAKRRELIGGDLMEGLSVGEAGFEQWLAAERERFRAARLRHLCATDGTGRTGRALEEALTHGLKLLALDPLQEHVHRALMRLYAAQGRHDAALAQYERCRRELSHQLGVSAGPETDDLARDHQGQPPRGPARTSVSPQATRSPTRRTPATPDRPSIAVLPFTNLSGDPEQQYFSDGITEDIITELSRYHSLLVIARNSCFQFRGVVDVAAVRSALGVRYVVEGSVRKAGSRIRVTAQLIDAMNRTQIWAERYDRENRDIFAVQDEVTAAVVATLEGRIAASGAEHARRKPTSDWVAYDYFLQGPGAQLSLRDGGSRALLRPRHRARSRLCPGPCLAGHRCWASIPVRRAPGNPRRGVRQRADRHWRSTTTTPWPLRDGLRGASPMRIRSRRPPSRPGGRPQSQ